MSNLGHAFTPELNTAKIAAHERALMTESYDHMFGE